MVQQMSGRVNRIRKLLIHGIVAVMALTGVQLLNPNQTAEASRMYVPPSNSCYERKVPFFYNRVKHEVRCFKDYHDLANRLGQRDYWYTFSYCLEYVPTGRHYNCYWGHLHIL